MIDKFKSRFYIKDLCHYLGIHRSGYYRYLKRKTYLTHQEQTKNHLKMLIKNYHEIYPTKGYRSIRKDIKDETGWVVSYYLMYRCFKEMGISSKARRKAFRRPKHQSDKFPNLVNNNWLTSRPFEIVCSDTTMLVINGKKYDWNYHIDVFNNEMVGWNLANYKHGMGVMNHHNSLKDFLKIKEERGIDDFQDPWKAIEIYVNYFNNKRPSWKLNYLSPVEYRIINGIK